MPGASREKRLVEEWADQVCWDELRHSNLDPAGFHRCHSHDNVLLVGSLDYLPFSSNASSKGQFGEGDNTRRSDVGCWHLAKGRFFSAHVGFYRIADKRRRDIIGLRALPKDLFKTQGA